MNRIPRVRRAIASGSLWRSALPHSAFPCNDAVRSPRASRYALAYLHEPAPLQFL